MFSAIFVIHILICLGIIGLVLLQQGKGAEAGAIFGSSGDSVVSAGGAPSFMSKLTTGLAIGFMLTSILLVKAYMGQMGVSEVTKTDILDNSVINSVVSEPVAAAVDSVKEPIADSGVPTAETENVANSLNQESIAEDSMSTAVIDPE